jgi:uncharacterized protein YndB with AHSA1/START domain
MEPTYKVFIFVNRPRHDVFEAVADPKELSSYFTTGGASARLEQGQTVTWDFADFPGAFPVHVAEVVPNEKIVFKWQANEPGSNYHLQVTMRFSDVDDGRTKVEVEEAGWRDTKAGLEGSYGNCMGWSQMLAALKMWVEHRINLREGAYK